MLFCDVGFHDNRVKTTASEVRNGHLQSCPDFSKEENYPWEESVPSLDSEREGLGFPRPWGSVWGMAALAFAVCALGILEVELLNFSHFHLMEYLSKAEAASDPAWRYEGAVFLVVFRGRETGASGRLSTHQF